MSITRYYTVGAVARDARSLKSLDERLEERGVAPDALLVLSRRRDERLVQNILPGARTRQVESGMSRMQWFELASTYLGVTAVSVLMGAVHLPTGIVVQAVMTLAAIIGVILYHRHSQLERKLVGMGLPEELAKGWSQAFPGGFALALVTVTSDHFEDVQEAFLETEGLESPLAVDRRPVL